MMTVTQWLDKEAPALNLAGLAEHTDDIGANFGFICVAQDPEQKKAHIEQAVARGAAAVLLEQADVELSDVRQFEVAELAERRGELAAEFYGQPSHVVKCIGITGTNGKTSVAYHIADLLNALGHKAGYMGTLGWGLMNELQDPNLTTSNAVALQRRLATLRDIGCDVVPPPITLVVIDHGGIGTRCDHFEVFQFGISKHNPGAIRVRDRGGGIN